MSGSGGHSNILREFLLKLGYQEDEASRRKFSDALKIMTKTVAELGLAVAGAAIGVIAGVRQIASGMDQLYFVSQRTKASVASIRATQGAFEDLGGSAEEARAALEKVGDYVRQSPGNRQFIESLTDGKKYTDAATAMEDLSAAFQKMLASGTDISVIFAHGAEIGLSQHDVLVLLQKDYEEVLKQYHKLDAAILGSEADQQRLTNNAHAFTVSYNELSRAINDFAINFGDMLNTKLKPMIDNMKDYLKEHSAEINAFLKVAAKVITTAMVDLFEFAKKAGEFIEELIGWYRQLSPEGKQAAEVIGAVAAAIFLMNTAIGKSPVVRLIALGSALFALYEDYRKWKDTGQSSGLIDWAKWEPDIKAAIKAITAIAGWINTVVSGTIGWQAAIEGLIALKFASWLLGVSSAMLGVGTSTTSVLGLLWRLLPLLALLGLTGPAGSPTTADEQNQMNDNYIDTHKGGSVIGNWIRRNYPALSGRGKEGLVNPLASEDMTDVQRNFLDTLALPESQGDYRVKNGGTDFDSFAQFPNYVGAGGTSTASGRYQFIKATWDEAAAALNLKDFSPESQDKAAWWLAQREYFDKSGGRNLHNDWADPKRRASIAAALYGRWPSTGAWASKEPTPIVPPAPKTAYDQTGQPIGKEAYGPPAPPSANATVPELDSTKSGWQPSDMDIMKSLSAPAAGSAIHNNTTVSQINHINVNAGHVSDPNRLASLVADASATKLAQAQRNGIANAT